MVEQVEELRAELHRQAFLDRRVFDQREVDVLETRPIQDVASGIAEVAERREGERRRVEPAFRRRVVQSGLTNQIRAVIAQKAQVRDACIAVVELRKQRDGERPAGLQRDHAESLPAGKQLV